MKGKAEIERIMEVLVIVVIYMNIRDKIIEEAAKPKYDSIDWYLREIGWRK